MNMKDISLSLVFPAYNEENNIGKLIEEADKAASSITSDYEIVVVNDGSKDGTKSAILDKIKQFPRVRLLNHAVNKGYGQTVWDGLKSATKEWVFFADSDLQFDLKEISKLLEHKDNYKVVIGYRAPRMDPPHRIINAKVWNGLVKGLFGLNVKDIDCAFKLLHSSTIDNLDIRSGGATFSAELLLRLRQNGWEIKEVPVKHLPSYGKVPTGAKPSVVIRALKELFGLYRNTELGKPIVREVVKFAMVGAVSTVLDFAFLNIAYELIGLNIYWSIFLGFIAGTLNGYYLNNYWTYKHLGRKAELRCLLNFAVIGGIGLAITEGLMHLLTVESGLNHNLSKLAAVFVVFFWNFFGNRYSTFKK